jgi:hypothetical protein
MFLKKHTNITQGRKSIKLKSLSNALPQCDIPIPDSIQNKYIFKFKYGIKTLVLKPAYVYYIKLHFMDGKTIYKLGFTSMSIRNRISYFNLHPSTKVEIIEIIKYPSIKQAYYTEQLLHKHFSKYRYHGAPIIASGNTELYNSPLI